MATKMIKWDSLNKRQKVARWKGVLRVLQGLTRHQRTKHFDMFIWLSETECGTVGCIAGHCALDARFAKQGFVATLRRSRFSEEDGVWNMPDAELFFGPAGESEVFTNEKIRTYGEAVRAVKKFIKRLENGDDAALVSNKDYWDRFDLDEGMARWSSNPAY